MAVRPTQAFTALVRTGVTVGCLLCCATVNAAPSPRIVSLSPHLTEMVYAAGAAEHLVGTVEYSDYPLAALDIPRIGDSFRLDYEALALLQPDIVLVWASGNPIEMQSRLRLLGYQVVALESGNLNAVASQLMQIGELAGTGNVADLAARNYLEEFAELRQEYAGRTPISVFLQLDAEPYFTVTGEHVLNEVLELCGGANIFADVAGLAPAVELESVLHANPQVILATGAAHGSDWQSGWRRWQALAAVQAGTLYDVDPNLTSRTGPRIIAGARKICEALDKARVALGVAAN